MQSYKCPNCGRIYNYGDFDDSKVMLQCMNCRYPLKKAEDVKTVRNPYQPKVIGEVPNPNRTVVECPYCHSTNTKKITNTSKAIHTALFGIFSMGRNRKNYHCNKCGSDF